MEREKDFWAPTGVTVDDEGRVFVTESTRNRVQVYQKQGAAFLGIRL
jgi:hypothetical protein